MAGLPALAGLPFHRRRARTLLAVLVVVLVGSLAAVAVLLSQAQQVSHDSAMRRFSERAQISAALTQSVFSALGSASGRELQRQYGGSAPGLRKALKSQLRESRAPYIAVLDARGRVLAAVGRPPGSLGGEGQALRGPTLSNVMGRGKARHVQYAIPFGRGADRRTVAQGVPLALLSRFFDDYLARLRQVDSAGLAITDERGQVITRKGPVSLRQTAGAGRLATKAAVPGTPWTLRLEAERDRVLAGASHGRVLPWLILAGLVLAMGAGIYLYARLALTAGRQRETNRALRESREQIRSLVDALEEAVFLHHADGGTELLNASAKELLDTDLDSLETLAPGWQVLDADGRPLEPKDTPVQRAFATGTPCSRVLGLQRPDGSRRWLSVRARPLTRTDGDAPHAVVASCTDVTEQREMELHLTDLAQRDSLTGLWNRRRFEEDLAKQLARCRRYGERAALLMLDLDGFKEVNDTFGHLVGDEVLCALGDGLTRRLRASDSAARMGGDEFAVLLANVDRSEAEQAAREVAARLTEFARDALGSRVELKISVGLTLMDCTAGGVNEVLEAADRAMYADKRRPGRSRVVGESRLPVSADYIESGAPEPAGARFASLRALLTAVQARDSYTASHSRQVVLLARAVARRLGLDPSQVAEVESAALLHDLGKIAVPDAILRKRGPLSDQEQVIMRQHPVVGAQMVSSIPELAHLGPAIRAEHERWDGSGYPDGLAGDAIPLASRIAFVCDAYHAMTHDRPYRRALSHEDAIEEIEVEAGRQFCPTAAAALIEVLQIDGGASVREPAATSTTG